jgi:hypothetical protein
MRAGTLTALTIALGSMAVSIALGQWNRFVPGDPGVAVQPDREVYVAGGFEPGDLHSLSVRVELKPGVLNQEKLSQLGFRHTLRPSPLRRDVLLVLEHDTLLTVVDAGLNADALEDRYPDQERFLIVKGLVGAYFYSNRGGADGYIRGLLPSQLYLPSGSRREGPFRLHAGRMRFPFVTE